MYYRAPKRYLAATFSALAFAILFMLVAIAFRSMPETAADASEVAVELRKSLQR